MEYLGDIRVLVDLCLKVLFQYELFNRSFRKNNFEVVSYPTIVSSSVLRYQCLWSDSLLHVEGLLYDLSMLLLLRELALVKVRTLGLVYYHCNTVYAHFYHLLPCCFYNFRLQIPLSTIHIALVSPSLRRTSAPIQFAIVLGVGFRVPAKPLRFEHWGAHEDLTPSSSFSHRNLKSQRVETMEQRDTRFILVRATDVE